LAIGSRQLCWQKKSTLEPLYFIDLYRVAVQEL